MTTFKRTNCKSLVQENRKKYYQAYKQRKKSAVCTWHENVLKPLSIPDKNRFMSELEREIADDEARLNAKKQILGYIQAVQSKQPTGKFEKALNHNTTSQVTMDYLESRMDLMIGLADLMSKSRGG